MKRWYITAGALIALQASLLYLFGQPATCTCGVVKLWEGVVNSVGNSQQFTDWYTFSHIIHGFIFYGILRLLFPKMSVAQRFTLAVGIEVAWEITENTPWLIEHYRQQALAVGYSGDSILNSVMDTLAMCFGFLMARKLPVAVIVGIAIALEVWTGYVIRDNLTLNTVNLIYQFPVIKEWQGAGLSG